MKSSEEIRAHFIGLLNQALPRLSMFGGELLPDYLLSFLAFIDEREPDIKAHRDTLCSHFSLTKATSCIGEAFSEQTNLPSGDSEIGSVYAEISFKMGYLDTARTLDQNEFTALCSELRGNCGSRDFTTEEVVKEFGIPSWKSAGNPYYPCVYLYFCNDKSMGVIAFDFWNELNFEPEIQKVSGKFGELPVLRDFRIPSEHFSQDFTFMPFGRKITKRD